MKAHRGVVVVVVVINIILMMKIVIRLSKHKQDFVQEWRMKI